MRVLRRGCEELPEQVEIWEVLSRGSASLAAATACPCTSSCPADLITPVIAYLRIAHNSKYSFLLESVLAGENIARYSFIGADPFKLVRLGPNETIQGDPMLALERELSVYKYVKIPQVPTFTGGAIGYVAYDAIQHFEPKTARPLKDTLGIPEAVFMLADTLLIYDHLFQNIKVVSHVFCPENSTPSNLAFIYQTAVSKVRRLARAMVNPVTTEVPQQPITLGNTATSNVGKEGYQQYVTRLKEHIVAGDIIQAVPSQRLSRPTQLHPFNAYRRLRQLNPSPYMFYLDCGELQIVGASPETLCKVEANKVYNHAIAGTTKRGETDEEDQRLAEHIMLVDLARNDVNRVCQPKTVKVSGILREGLTRFDAFRSIFPAGTVSGAPKIKAIELRRGVYAGAVGRFDFATDAMDTCIAIRTTVFKDGVAYFQAGGGIVHDSVEEDEYHETINKLTGNAKALDEAERYWYDMQQATA
ncbi:anthranilate synthase component [Lactarius indigo]|nr:anthranilate synthase component [Lactarius indigo]